MSEGIPAAELIVYRKPSAEDWVEPLDKREIWIGNHIDGDEPADIRLVSRRVSQRHLRLSLGRRGWALTRLGRNPVSVNSEELALNETRLLQFDDQIAVGEYELTLVQRVDSGRPAELESTESQLVEHTKSVHEALHREQERQHGGSAAGMYSKSPEQRARIVEILDATISREVAGIESNDPDRLQRFVQLGMHRRISEQLLMAGAEQRRQQRSGQPMDAHLAQIEKSLARAMELTFERDNMEVEAARLDERFSDEIRKFTLDFNPGLKRFAVHQLMRRDLEQHIFGYGPLQDLLDMECVTEVMVVSRDRIFIEKFGVVEDSRRSFMSDAAIQAVVERIVEPIGRQVNQSDPMVDARLPSGSRVNIVVPPVAIKGPCITIRKFASTPLTMEDLERGGALSEQMFRFLKSAVGKKRNIFISGGTGTGKTTLLNCLSRFIPRKERIVTVEDTAELQMQQDHVVTLEGRAANVEGKGAVTMTDLVRNALRMRPDRIIVGECRGPEAKDMLQAMNTGHEGSMGTGHANAPPEMIMRLETMILEGHDMPVAAIRAQIAAALDLIVQLERSQAGKRYISSIDEVGDVDELTGHVVLNPVFSGHTTDEDGLHVRFRHTGYIPVFVQELLGEGAVDVDAFF